MKSNAAFRSRHRSLVPMVLGALALGVTTASLADDANWMQENLHRFRNNDLTMLSYPASHDAGMYKQDLDRFEIGVENLHVSVSISGPLVPDDSWGFSQTGIVEAGELLAIFDVLMGIVRDIDNQCIVVPEVIEVCTTFGIEDAVWGWIKPYHDLATQKPEDLSITQNLDLYGQLSSGVRRFDLRPKELGGTLFIHHSAPGIEGVGKDVSKDWSLDIRVPCVPVFGGCVPGTDRSYHLGKVEFNAGGAVRSVSATGPRVDEVLADVRRFMEEGHRELVMLRFGNYWAGWQGNEFNATDYDRLVGRIEAELGPWLLTPDMLPAISGLDSGERLLAARLPQLIADQGRVIVTLGDRPFAYTDPDRGLWPGSVLATSGTYSDKDSLTTMRDDQRHRWYSATGRRFALWWTLTCQGFDCAVRDLAGQANPELPGFVASLSIPNANGNNINEIWVDFSEETAATAIAIGLNPVAATIDIKPGNDRNTINTGLEGVVWVAVLGDLDSIGDALQVDVSSVRFGPGAATPDRYRVADANHDGLPDLLLRFRMPEVGLACADREARLTGRLHSGQRFVGIDSIAGVGCRAAPRKATGKSSR